MTNKTMAAIAFIFGVATGYAVADYLLKDKYEKRYQDELGSLKLVMEAKKEKTTVKHVEAHQEEDKKRTDDNENIMEYAKRLQKNGYIDYSGFGGTAGGKEEMGTAEPYVISPEEFGELEEYEQISLTFFADGVLTDDDYEVIENPDEIVGEESLTHFGEYEDDSVFVRNDKMKCDYEILLDNRTYDEVLKTIPHPTEE